jgi:toxin ParE1/3/4
MPSSRKLRLTAEARDDFRDLLQYTLQRWGREQRDSYKTLMQRRMRELTTYPELGRSRDEFFIGCRSLVVEQYLVYYLVTDTELLVARILHAKRDAADLVKDPAS